MTIHRERKPDVALATLMLRDGWVLRGLGRDYWLEHPRNFPRQVITVRTARALCRRLALRADPTATDACRWVLP